jgi:hypothetical protein
MECHRHAENPRRTKILAPTTSCDIAPLPFRVARSREVKKKSRIAIPNAIPTWNLVEFFCAV